MYLYRIQAKRYLSNPFARERQMTESIKFVFAVTKKKPKDKRWLLETLRENPWKAYLDENVLAIYIVKDIDEQGCLKTLVWTDDTNVELLSDISVSQRHDLLHEFMILNEITKSFNTPRKNIEIRNEWISLVYQPPNIFYDFFKKRIGG